jgi:glycogen synthase
MLRLTKDLTSTANVLQDRPKSSPRSETHPRSNGPAPLNVLYAAGPGDIVQMYRDLLSGKEPPFEMSIAFSKQFLDWCDESGVRAHLISWSNRKDSIKDGWYYLENIPRNSLYYGQGIKYYLGSAMYGLKIVAKVLRKRPGVLIVDSGTSDWILFSLVSILRIPVVAVLHSTFWPMGFPPKRSYKRLLYSLDGLFFRRFAAATVCVSPECERQMRILAGVPKGPVYQCRAQFRTGFLDSVNPVPTHDVRPFRVLFVGRTVRNKGIFLIVSIADRLRKEMPGTFTWKIVGGGPDLEALKGEVTARNLTDVVDVAGRLPREQLLDWYGWAHSMIVPTTSEYSEGLAMTAAESVLAGRPVVLSSVVPAWEVLGDAAIKAETDNVDSFVEVFRRLATDGDYYERCRHATTVAGEQFYDISRGLGTVLGRAIEALNRHQPQ